MGQLFLCLWNWTHCYPRGVATVRWRAVHCARTRAFIYFIFQLTKNADRYGIVLWIDIDGYNERVHHKKQHASSIHTIPSKNIAFIQVFFFESRNSMQYRSRNAISDQTGSIILSFEWTRAIGWIQLVQLYPVDGPSPIEWQYQLDWYSHLCQVRLSPFNSFVVVGHPIMLLIYAD